MSFLILLGSRELLFFNSLSNEFVIDSIVDIIDSSGGVLLNIDKGSINVPNYTILDSCFFNR